jgi:hypothetical protein
MEYFRERLQSLRYAFHRHITPFIEFLDKFQEARDTIRLTYPPTHRTFIDEIGMRGTQDSQGYFVCIINLGSKHRLEIDGEAVLNETFIEPLGIGGNKCEVVSDTDLVVAIKFFLDYLRDGITTYNHVRVILGTLWPAKDGSPTSDRDSSRMPIGRSRRCRVH